MLWQPILRETDLPIFIHCTGIPQKLEYGNADRWTDSADDPSM